MKSVDLPTLGRPTIPIVRATGVNRTDAVPCAPPITVRIRRAEFVLQNDPPATPVRHSVLVKKLLLAAVVTLTLAGCATAAPADPVASPSAPSSSPTPTPTQDAAEPAAIVIGPAGFAVHAASDEVLTEVRWDAEPEALLAALDLAFDAEPGEEFSPGDGSHIADSDVYRWVGLSLGIARMERPRQDYFQPASMHVEAAVVEGIEIRTRGGLKVGSRPSSAPDFAGALRQDWADGRIMFKVDPEYPELIDAEHESTRMVGLLAEGEGEPIEEIFAPEYSKLFF